MQEPYLQTPDGNKVTPETVPVDTASSRTNNRQAGPAGQEARAADPWLLDKAWQDPSLGTTSHRIDPGHRPHTGSQDQVLGESPPSLCVHARVCQRNITCWSGHLHQEQHSTNKLTARCREDGINTEDLDHVGHRHPLGKWHRTRK